MTNSQAILIGAALIAASVFLTKGVPVALADHYGGGGAYELMHHSNVQANAGVFRLDTNTGEVSYCYIADSSGTNIVCSRPVR